MIAAAAFGYGVAHLADDLDARFFRESGVAADVAAVSEPVLEDLGFHLVRVNVSGRDGGTVQLMVERENGTVTIDDCALISTRLSPVLDAHDPMPGGYNLEVSSPGIDRPLVRPRDFEIWTGYEAKVELKELVDGRRRFRGQIEGFEDGEIRLRVRLRDEGEPETIGLPVALVAEAKLVLTEALIRSALAKGGQT